jgi:cystathionine beta-lyase/cystathionine gamma-synthase
MTPAGFETAIPESERPQTLALESAATGISTTVCMVMNRGINERIIDHVLVDTNGTEDYRRQYQSQDNRSKDGHLAQYRSTQIVAGTVYMTATVLTEKTNKQTRIHTSFLGDRNVSGLIFIGYLKQCLPRRLK